MTWMQLPTELDCCYFQSNLFFGVWQGAGSRRRRVLERKRTPVRTKVRRTSGGGGDRKQEIRASVGRTTVKVRMTRNFFLDPICAGPCCIGVLCPARRSTGCGSQGGKPHACPLHTPTAAGRHRPAAILVGMSRWTRTGRA